jgi:hypothetical protein
VSGARADRDCARQPDCSDRHEAAVRRPSDAELPLVVVAPTLSSAATQHRARVPASSHGDGSRVRDSLDPHRQRARDPRAVAELPRVIPPPAVNSPGCEHGTDVAAAGRRLDCVGDPSDPHRHGTFLVGVVPKLAGVVRPPAIHSPRDEDRARFILQEPGRDSNRVGNPPYPDGYRAIADAAVAKGPTDVATPAVDPVGREQGAGMGTACRDSDGVGDAGDPDGHGRVFGGSVGLTGRVTRRAGDGRDRRPRQLNLGWEGARPAIRRTA